MSADQTVNFTDGAPVTAGGSADGQYVTQADMEEMFGVSLLAKWTNRDATSSELDVDVLATAIRDAEGEVEDLFRDGPYAIPFVFLDARSNQTVKRWVMAIAGEKLFFPRAMQGGQRATPGTPTEREKASSEADRARKQMLNYVHGGGPRFNARRSISSGNAPTVI